jgi:hypothetical protein
MVGQHLLYAYAHALDLFVEAGACLLGRDGRIVRSTHLSQC